MLAPATLAAVPSTRAIPDRDVFYVAHPIRSVQATGTTVAGVSAGGVSALSVISLRRNGISTTQAGKRGSERMIDSSEFPKPGTVDLRKANSDVIRLVNRIAGDIRGAIDAN